MHYSADGLVIMIIMSVVSTSLLLMAAYILRYNDENKGSSGGNTDDGDGDLYLDDVPDLDLPPGVSLPERGPRELVPV